MNTYLQSVQYTEQHLTQELSQHGFLSLCQANIELFQRHLRHSFSYAQFVERTARAKNPLEHYDDLISYISLYGMAHYQRFTHLFSCGMQAGINIPDEKLQIIDYGCGQGIATLAVLEKIATFSKIPKLIHITLIEPSALSLQRAITWVKYRAKALNLNVEIELHQQYFDCLQTQKTTELNEVCLHLYSNILDMYLAHRFNMQHLIQLGKNQAEHNYHLAISPDFLMGNQGFEEFLKLQQPQHLIYNVRDSIRVDEYMFKLNTFHQRYAPVRASISYVREL
ncbi:hypothetical protein VXQ23_15465 [Acinetobacter variabilis]|uniref:hypothetical protein n=1 Tax=Acinetobacter variabilis TaxID=70346 RepID=UPI003A8B0DE7